MRLAKWLLAGGVIFGFVTGGSAEETGWVLTGERMLPAPAGASDALRNAVAAASKPDVEAAIANAPDTPEEIQASILQRQAVRDKGVEEALKQLSLSYTEDVINGVTVRYVNAPTDGDAFLDGLFVHLHGGGYVYGGGLGGLAEALLIAKITGINVVSVDYRMAPDHPAPAAVEDVVAVWKGLLKDNAATSMAMGGTSAGGGLTLASVMKLRDLGLDLPAAQWLGTPWTDLTQTGDSRHINEGIDRVLVSQRGSLDVMAKLYAGENDLKSPLVSPVYGSFEGLPPAQLVTGTRDLFLSDTVRAHRKLRGAGIHADLNVYEGVSHAGYAFVDRSPEQAQVYGELRTFLAQHLK